ncbi:MAG: GDP-mannose 4,6-dehydratase, partial [Pseudomonadota bacterium]
MSKTYLVTGGAGFIGSNLVHFLLQEQGTKVVVLDALTYSGNLENLVALQEDSKFIFVQGDICDTTKCEQVFTKFTPDVVFHLAAETHVDRSIDSPETFIWTNTLGSFRILETAHQYWSKLEPNRKEQFRFVHVSTDEVYGSLGTDGLFSEKSPYKPNSPYA